MASLTHVAKATRRSVNIGVALVITLIVGRIFLYWTVIIYKILVPTPPPPPTVGFGVLPAITFPAPIEGELTYRLETVDGLVPSYGPSVKVFFISFPQTTILGLDRGKQKAAALGFVFEPEQVAGTLYRWKNSQPQLATLDLDYTQGSFTMKTSWETNPKILTEVMMPDEVGAITETKNYFKQAGALPVDLEKGRVVTTLLKYSGGKMIPAVSASEAELVRVDLFRTDIDKRRVLPADPKKGLGRILISGSRVRGERILEAEYVHTQVEYEQFETYPLISGDLAWQRLTGGEGFVAVAPENGTQVVVRRVSLGYFDSLDQQQYLQPIYVFEGDEGFVGYVRAVADEWLE